MSIGRRESDRGKREKWVGPLHEFAWISITKVHNRNEVPHSSGAWKSIIMVSIGWVSSELSLLGLQMAAFLLCPHMAFPLCVQISSSYKDNHTGLGPFADFFFFI
jgi:hypothetical protein